MTMTVFVAVSQATLERVLGEACIELSRKKQVRREQKKWHDRGTGRLHRRLGRRFWRGVDSVMSDQVLSTHRMETWEFT